MKLQNKTLTRKLIFLLFTSLGAALVFFLVVFLLGTELLREYFITSDYIYNAETSYVKELQDYATANQLAATDKEALGKWAHKKGIRRFTISREQVLLYDSAYSDSLILVLSSSEDGSPYNSAYSDNLILEEADSEVLHYNWQYFHTVSFADGDADVYIYADYEIRIYMLFYLFAGIGSTFIWLILFTFGIQKELRYIHKLSSDVSRIAHGELDFEIVKNRDDELGMLAQDLNRMRLSLIEKEENEKKMRASQDQLVLSMAHDLRTPLTGLVSFIEIAGQQATLPACSHFLAKARTKADQIRDLSDQLFDFFLISSEKSMLLEAPEDVQYALGEYLSELCGLLQLDGYSFTTEHLYWKPVKIRICTDYMGRIINNILSNIQKYADRSVPVALYTEYFEEKVSITIQNKPEKPDQYVQGTGIGMQNIDAMMTQMGGKCETDIRQDSYAITLTFPIVKSSIS